MIMLDSRTLY